eukprot:TRINITY_DN80088_c0_g1_i1.p1 TRINITY_DN80088_c0_g1~~TRINITY_DN80088_c0_g1_i1.p1  ORF type:complete len:415 (+),score=68.34 TRINITY_DN80088_c0_g1_i1:31-1275(+)
MSILVAVGSYEGVLAGWRFDETKRVRLEQEFMLKDNRESVTAIASTPDGRWLVTGSNDESLNLYDGASLTAVGHSIQFEGKVNAISFPARNHLLFVSQACISVLGGGWKPTMRIHDAHKKEVTCAAIRADGSQLISVGRDQRLKVWSASTGRTVFQHKFDTQPNTCCYSADGSLLLVTLTNSVVVFKTVGTSELVTLKTEKHVHCAAFVSQEFVVVGTEDKKLTVYRLSDGAAVAEDADGHGNRVKSVAVVPEGNGNALIFSCCSEGIVCAWRFAPARLQRKTAAQRAADLEAKAAEQVGEEPQPAKQKKRGKKRKADAEEGGEDDFEPPLQLLYHVQHKLRWICLTAHRVPAVAQSEGPATPVVVPKVDQVVIEAPEESPTEQHQEATDPPAEAAGRKRKVVKRVAKKKKKAE